MELEFCGVIVMKESERKVQSIERRQFVSASIAATVGVSVAGFPMLSLGDSSPLKVGAYGGYFKDSFDQFIFPEFTKATGIQVESVAEPTGEAWLAQLNAAASAGTAPADVSMIAQVPMLKGQKTELWLPLDESKLPNLGNVSPNFVHRYPDGRLDGVGAVAWYITLVTNSDVYPNAPESWDELWNPANKGQLGLLALVTNSFLLEITSKTFFGSTDVLDDEAGQLEVFSKLAELRDNVALWYRDEAQFEQALKSGEIPMGQYYHDVAGLAAADGFPVRTTFPKEGGVSDSGLWAVSKASKKVEESHVFINYMCQPDVQSMLSLNVGTAPTVPRGLLSLTDEEFSAVSSEIDPIVPRYDIYDGKEEWLAQKWSELIVG